MRIMMKIPRSVCLALVAAVLWALPGAAQNIEADSVHLRNDCRLAAQVLQLGQPANKGGWALHLAAACGAEGGRALSSQLNRLRATVVPTPELEAVAFAAVGFLDRSIYETALSIASDEAAGTAARVQSFRILLSYVDPRSTPAYEDLADGATITMDYDSRFAVGEPLPSGYREEVLGAASSVVNRSSPGQVKTAAGIVHASAVVELRRRP